MAQMARFRQPGAAAIAFMNTLAATEARFSARARSARRPCTARAMPRQAKTSAAASGMAASRAATAGRWRVAWTIRYWAVKLTAAAAAARTHNPAAALRSHRPERSLGRPGGAGWLPGLGAGVAGPDMISRRPGAGRWPVMSRPVPALGRVTSGIATVMSDRYRGRIGVLVFAGVGLGGADADSGQPAGYRPDTGAGGAGQAHVPFLVMDAGQYEDQQRQDAQPDQERHDGQGHGDRVGGAGDVWHRGITPFCGGGKPPALWRIALRAELYAHEYASWMPLAQSVGPTRRE